MSRTCFLLNHTKEQFVILDGRINATPKIIDDSIHDNFLFYILLEWQDDKLQTISDTGDDTLWEIHIAKELATKPYQDMTNELFSDWDWEPELKENEK